MEDLDPNPGGGGFVRKKFRDGLEIRGEGRKDEDEGTLGHRGIGGVLYRKGNYGRHCDVVLQFQRLNLLSCDVEKDCADHCYCGVAGACCCCYGGGGASCRRPLMRRRTNPFCSFFPFAPYLTKLLR